tara:strand:+ start:653 stop:4753 length:4101 start_codon:yes stop_codon:yes gene_type:complete
MHCINKSHPEYLTLLEESNLHPHILQARISIWMDRFGNDAFPTLKDLNTIPSSDQIYKSTNPLNDLGVKYLANKDGFMPANINLADLQRDARKLNLTVHRSSRNTWFLKDSNNKIVNPSKVYRQIDSQSSILPYKALTDKLLLWAKTHGISVTTMQELMNRVTETDSLEGSVAVADLLNRIIAIDPEKEMSDTLAEEVAHFATSILRDDTSVKKAMENIVNTDIYKEVKEVYASVYNTEAEFRKEAVDKLLAKSILNEFKTTNENKGIIAYIKAIFNKFKKWLSRTKKSDAAEEIKNDLYPLAQSILSNEYLGNLETPSSEEATIFHQKGLAFTEESKKEILKKVDSPAQKTKAEFAIKAANMLNNRLQILRRSARKQETIDSLQKEIDKLKEQIAKQEFTASIMGVLQYATKELVPIEALLKKRDKEKITNGNELELIEKFVDMYNNLFNSLDVQMYKLELPENEKKEIKDMMKDVLSEINRIGNINKSFIKEHAIKVLNKGNTAPDGSKIDKDFNGEEIVEQSLNDSGWWRFGVGNYKFSNSGILRTAHKIIFDTTQKIKRQTIDKGNILLAAQELMTKSGVKVEDLIEKDSKGKYTQDLIRPEDWASYYEARDEMRSEIARVLGFDSFFDIDTETLNKKQLNTYKKAIRDFNNKHSTIVLDDRGNFAGRKPKKKNPRFAELMKNKDVKNYYDLLIETKRESLAKLPLQYRTERALYSVPGIRSQFLEKLTDNNKSFLSNMLEVAKEAFFIDEDDTEFGEVTALNNRMVPIYFTQRFEDPANVSRDLTRSFTIFSEMAENFKSMGEIAGDMEVIMSQLSRRDYIKGKRKIEGIETKDYKILETLVEANIYGIERKDVTFQIPKTKLTEKLHLADKTISATKVVSNLARYISMNNLALNAFTSTAGYLKGTADSLVEDQIGLYTTVESKNWARAEYAKNILQVLSEAPKKKQTNKMHLMLQRNNVVDLYKMLRNTNKNKLLSEVTSRDLLFLNYRTADYALKGRVALAIYDNTRLVDGEFITRKNFLEKRAEEGVNEKEARKEWKNYQDKSLYNAYEVVDGILKIKEDFKKYVTDGVENTIVGKITHVANTIDGTLSESDKGALARSIYGDFVLMHRGWFVNMIDGRFMKEKVNMITGESEMGIYPASWKFIKDDIFKAKRISPIAIYSAYKNLSNPAVKRGVKKTVLDLMYLQIIGTLAAVANLAADADEEDDYLIQLIAYQMNRVLLEQAAGQPLIHPSEILQIIDEPVVGVRTIKDIVDISEAWNTDPYASGMYEGSTHATKWFLRKIPAFKNIYESQFPSSKNNFLKNQIINSPTYDYLKENAENEELSIIDRLLLIFKDQQPENTEDAIQYIEALEGDEY